jgi:hypothetical protein
LAYFLWEDKKEDKFLIETMKDVLEANRKVALNPQVANDEMPVYLKTSLEGTPVEHIYREDLEHHKKMRKKYGPSDLTSLIGIQGPVAVGTRQSSRCSLYFSLGANRYRAEYIQDE